MYAREKRLNKEGSK